MHIATRYARARVAYTSNNHESGRSESFVPGRLVRSDHWAVVDAAERDRRFEPVDDSHPDVRALEEAERAQVEARRADLARQARVPGALEGVDPTQPPEHARTARSDPEPSGPYSRTIGLARRQVEALHRSGDLPDYAAERIDRLVTKEGGLRAQGTAAGWVLAAGDPHYRSAFAKMLTGDKGHLLWTPEEQAAFRRVEEHRAMSLTDASGGYLVPLTLDPSVMLTSAGSVNPLRRIARVVQTATDSWKGITSAGSSAEWLAENTEAADGSPTLAQPDVPVHKGSVFVPFSYEVGMDAMDFLGQLQVVLADAAAQLQAAAFTTGDGTGKPAGVITGATSTVPSATVATFAAEDIYALQNALGPRFQPNAIWAANLTILNSADEFETTNGSKKFPELGAGRLLRKPVEEISHMTSSVATAERPLLYGDFKAGFVIADRIGSTLEIVQNLMGANGRPLGQRGAFLWFRTGSKVVIPEALRALAIA